MRLNLEHNSIAFGMSGGVLDVAQRRRSNGQFMKNIDQTVDVKIMQGIQVYLNESSQAIKMDRPNFAVRKLHVIHGSCSRLERCHAPSGM